MIGAKYWVYCYLGAWLAKKIYPRGISKWSSEYPYLAEAHVICSPVNKAAGESAEGSL
jgi:hypothetical protein